MQSIFPEVIRSLPQSSMPFSGVESFLSQGENHQIIFMSFNEDVVLPEHSHEFQWGVVLEGKVELEIEGVRKIYSKGDRYVMPKDAKHSGFIFKGFSAVEFFNQKDRYTAKK
jgi:quercetin dioxygenase-like cupin family protein